MRSFIRARRMCDWQDFDNRAAFARSRLGHLEGERFPPFLLLAEPGLSATEQRVCSETWMHGRLAAAAESRRLLYVALTRALVCARLVGTRAQQARYAL